MTSLALLSLISFHADEKNNHHNIFQISTNYIIITYHILFPVRVGSKKIRGLFVCLFICFSYFSSFSNAIYMERRFQENYTYTPCPVLTLALKYYSHDLVGIVLIRRYMKSFIAERLNSILVNLRYLRFKLLKYKENNKKICNTFDHNFQNIPLYIMRKVSLERYDCALTSKMSKVALGSFCDGTLHIWNSGKATRLLEYVHTYGYFLLPHNNTF